MKNILLILILIIPTLSCDRVNEPNFINKSSDEIIKYFITVENNQIIEYMKYVNDTLVGTTVYQDCDSIVFMIKTNSSNMIITKKAYYIFDNDLAAYAIDSSFNDYGMSVADFDYEYENGFLVNSSIDWNQNGENADSGHVYISRTIENENIIEITVSHSAGISCTDYLHYNNYENKIDIRDLTNGVTGRISKNLIQHATWNNGCPCGPSYSIACSDFNYEFDENGYVLKMIETYTPCYHLTIDEDVERTIKTTLYEYHFR